MRRKTDRTFAWESKPPTAIRVHVTAADIEAGYGEDGLSCPVARALEREAGLKEPQLLPRGAIVVGWDYNLSLPEKAAAWARRYDAGKPVEPFEFDFWRVSRGGPSWFGPS